MLIVDGSVKVLLRQATTRGATSLHSLELLTVLHATTDVVDNLTQGGTHGNLNQAHIINLTGQSEHLGTLALLGTDLSKPVSALGQDDGHVGESLDIVHVGGFHVITGLSGEGRLQGGLTTLTFHRVDQSGLLTADKCTGTVTDLDIEVKVSTENLLAEQTIFTSLLDGNLQAVNSERILSTDVNQTLVGVDAVTADGHRLNHRVGVTLHDGTVHECTGVALVPRAKPHFIPMGKPAPPRPRRPEALMISITSSGVWFSRALAIPW